jgi:hypothetical protein
VGQESPDGARIDQIRMIFVFCHSQTDKMSSGSAEKAKTQEHVAPSGIPETRTTEFVHRRTRTKFVSANSLDISRPQPSVPLHSLNQKQVWVVSLDTTCQHVSMTSFLAEYLSGWFSQHMFRDIGTLGHWDIRESHPTQSKGKNMPK